MKDKKGSSLVWVLIMLLIASIIFLTVGNIYISSNSRLIYKLEEKQAYLTSKSVTDFIFHSIEQKDAMGIHILAYLEVSGGIKLLSNDIVIPEEMGVCTIDLNIIENNRLKVKTTTIYKDAQNTMIGYMIRKYRLYDKDGVLVSDDYQGDIEIGELEDYFIEEYWVVSEYGIEK